MAKKAEIIVDVQSGSVDITSEKVLTLTEQLRLLKKEIQKAGPGPEQDLLIGKFNDISDELGKVNLKSREFLGALGTLPGPVGNFAGSLDFAVNSLRDFTSFSFKDIKTQLVGLGEDFKKIGKNIFDLTGITKIYSVLNEALAKSFVAVGVGEQAAATGARTFAAALTATGIGAIIVGLGLLIANWDKVTDAIMGATKETKVYEEAQVEVTKQVTDFNKKLFEVKGAIEAAKNGTKSKTEALKEYNDKLGATVGYAGDLTQAENLIAANTETVIQSIKLRAQAQIFYAKSAEAAAKAISGEGLEADFWDKTLNFIKSGGNLVGFSLKNIETYGKNIAENNKLANDFAAEGDKLTKEAIKNDEKLKKGLAQPPKYDTKPQENQNDKLVELEKKFQADLKTIQTKGEKERAAEQIKAQTQAEIEQVKALKLTKEFEDRRQALILQITQIGNQKVLESNKKFDDDLIKQREEFYNKTRQLEIENNSENYDLQITLLQNQLIREIQIYKDQVKEFNSKNKNIQISAEEQAAYILALETKSANAILKLREKTALKLYDNNRFLFDANLNDTTEYVKDMEEVFGEFNKILLRDSNNVNQVFTLNNKKFFDMMRRQSDGFIHVFEVGMEALDTFAIDARKAYQKEIDETQKSEEARRRFLADQLAKGQITQETFDKKSEELREASLKKREENTAKIKALDQLEIDSTVMKFDKWMEAYEKVGTFINALSDIQQASFDKEARIFDQRLALLDKDSEEYKRVLLEKRKAEEDNLNKVKKLQIAAALADAAVSIARIIIDTQRAIIAFSASVAPLGPAGIPIAASYATAAKISAALSIATITASGIAKIKQIQNQQIQTDTGEGGGGATGNGMGRGYADGGIVRGPGTSKSDSIPARLSNGEAVMTAGAVTMFAPMLSMMNQMGGGAAFSSDLNVASPDNPNRNNPAMEQQPLIMKTYVVENELTSTQQRQARLKDLSTL